MLLTQDLVKSKLPKRPGDANKGTFGSALIIAGSKNYPGAAILSCLSCARSGAGLVTLATSTEVYKVAVPKIPFVTFLEFSEVQENLRKYDAILIGPGLGKNQESRIMNHGFLTLLNKFNKKLVLDADALNILSETKDWFKTLETDAILTPHPGEMSRLTGLSVDKIQKNRKEITLKFSKLWNEPSSSSRKTIVLKGAETVIASPKGDLYTSPFSNPLLATAGTGDVLAGIITGLLAQGLSLTDASITGVYIHGMCAELLKEKFGVTGVVATDLVEILPEVFKQLSQKSV